MITKQCKHIFCFTKIVKSNYFGEYILSYCFKCNKCNKEIKISFDEYMKRTFNK